MESKDVLLKRKNKVLLLGFETADEVNKKGLKLVLSLVQNIKTLGFILSEELFNALIRLDEKDIINIHNWLIENLKTMVGADVNYMPMYPNFPKQVMKTSELKLYSDALFHYWKRDLHNELGIDIEEKTPIRAKEKKNKQELKNVKYKALELGTINDVQELLKNLLSSSVAYSKQDKEDLTVLIKEQSWKKFVPQVITNRENLAFLIANALNLKNYLPLNMDNVSNDKKRRITDLCVKKAIKNAKEFDKNIKTATDVLRVYVGVCGGDISLAKPTKFHAINRTIRKYILSLFEGTENIGLYMSLKDEQFKMAFRYLHVDEFKYKNGNLFFPKTSKAINEIRDKNYTKSIYSKLQEKIDQKQITELVALLQNEPGLFARKLDEVLRKTNKKNSVLKAFNNIAINVDIKILFTLREHFKNRTSKNDYRVFFPKGQVASAYCKPNTQEPVSEDLSVAVCAICEKAIKEKLSVKEKLNNVYINEELKAYKAPMVLRNLTRGIKTITRGSRVKTNFESHVLRAFIWWKDDVDNDLSAVLFNKDWQYVSHISYTNLKAKYGCHSGDVTYQRNNGYEGECEFIDLNTKELAKGDIKYVVFEVHNFRGLKFSETNCRFGFMKRKKTFKFIDRVEQNRTQLDNEKVYRNTDELFQPLTVETYLNITANATSVIPFVYDVETAEVVWCDMGVTNNLMIKNVENTLPSAVSACYACVNSTTPSLYDILYLNAEARGNIVKTKQEADTIFDIDDGITPYDIDVIVSNFLTI